MKTKKKKIKELMDGISCYKICMKRKEINFITKKKQKNKKRNKLFK